MQWGAVPPEIVSEFLASYEADRMAQRVRPRLIAKYVEQCARVGELGNWTVCLIGSTTSKAPRDIAGHTVGLVTRKALNDAFKAEGRYTIRRVLSPPDELIGLDDAQEAAAREAARKAAEQKEKASAPKTPHGPAHPAAEANRPGPPAHLPHRAAAIGRRRVDDPLVGFQVSFPHSEYQSKTEYIANTVWLQEDIYTIDEEDEA